MMPRSDECLPTLRGERLCLRRITAGDADDLLNSWGDPEVMIHMFRQPLANRADALRFIDGIHDGLVNGNLFQWGIEYDRGLIGTVSLVGFDTNRRRAEIGFALSRPFWGQGLMTEALKLVLVHAFGPMRLHRIKADVDPRNTAAQRLLNSLGFSREGLVRQRHFVNAEIPDPLVLGLLREDYLVSFDRQLL